MNSAESTAQPQSTQLSQPQAEQPQQGAGNISAEQGGVAVSGDNSGDIVMGHVTGNITIYTAVGTTVYVGGQRVSSEAGAPPAADPLERHVALLIKALGEGRADHRFAVPSERGLYSPR